VGRSRAPNRDDLFELFPDLPRPRSHSVDQQRARVLDLVAQAKQRAADNARRQQAAVQRVREAIAERQQRFKRPRPIGQLSVKR
jgi:hypothetical protein